MLGGPGLTTSLLVPKCEVALPPAGKNVCTRPIPSWVLGSPRALSNEMHSTPIVRVLWVLASPESVHHAAERRPPQGCSLCSVQQDSGEWAVCKAGSSYQQCLIGSRTHHGPVISDKDRVPMPRVLVMGPSHLGDGLQGPLALLLV